MCGGGIYGAHFSAAYFTGNLSDRKGRMDLSGAGSDRLHTVPYAGVRHVGVSLSAVLSAEYQMGIQETDFSELL